jgi:oligopeptide transport system permease protein
MVLGIVAALWHNTLWDTLAVMVAILGVSVPTFVLAPILQYWLGLKLGWFPIAFFESWIYSVLPSLALSVFVVSTVARFMRTEMLEVMGQDYITLAKAKGISGLGVIVKHVLRNVEQIFAVPGIGEQFVESVLVNDYAMILGTTIFFSVLFILALLIQDILYGIIDPRIRVSGAKE